MDEERAVEAISPRVVDALLAVGVAIILSLVIALSQATTGEAPSLGAYLFAIAFGAILLFRRRMPLTVLILSILAMFTYYVFGFPQIGVALPVVAALFSAAEAGRTRMSILGGAVVFAVALFFRLRDDPQPLGVLLGLDSVVNIALIAAAIALGFGLRAYRLNIHQQRELSRLTREQAERAAELRIQGERERISRDLHDSVGHSLSVISLHAGAGSEAVGYDDRAALAAFERIREQSSSSLQELRSMVRLLRAQDEHESERYVRSLSDIEVVLNEAESAGIAVENRMGVSPGELSPAVDSTAYRVVQESVTNAIRHSAAKRLSLSARVTDGTLLLEVTDDGVGDSGTNAGGYGLRGMTERVQLLNGSVSIRTSPKQGFTVKVSMPARLQT